MPTESVERITQLLADVGQGRRSAADQLLPLVYDELRDLARHFFRGQRPDHTLQPTALVHEAFARLVKPGEASGSPAWNSRAHFFAVAAKAMRQILANHARDRRAAKRGGDWHRVTLSQEATPLDRRDVDLLDIDEALGRLAALDGMQTRIVELRFFADMTNEEIAHVLEVSVSTIEREWRMAKAWLATHLREPELRRAPEGRA
jgi:RNA polymerase sigma-70 factor, ECF subfamily